MGTGRFSEEFWRLIAHARYKTLQSILCKSELTRSYPGRPVGFICSRFKAVEDSSSKAECSSSGLTPSLRLRIPKCGRCQECFRWLGL